MDESSAIRVNNTCCTCLSVDRKLTKLSGFDDGVTSLFFLLSCDTEAYELLCYRELADLVICWECKALINRLCKFRDQACKAQKQLQVIVDKEGTMKHASLSQLAQSQQTAHYECITLTEDNIESDRESLFKSNSEAEFLLLSDDLNDSDDDKSNIDTNDDNKLIDSKNNATMREKNYSVIEMTEEEMREYMERRKAERSFVLAEFKCESCIEVFKDDEERLLHVREAHEMAHDAAGGGRGGDKYRRCDICAVRVRRRWFREHRGDHYRRYRCHFCSRAAPHELTMLRHLRLGHAARVPPRELRKLRKRSYLKNPGLKPWRADVPPDARTTIGYRCSQCQQFFDTRQQRTMHIQKTHRSYKCSTCGRKFTGSHNLFKHQKLHTGTLPKEQCPTCGKLVRRDTLRAHMRVHENAAVTCAECDKTLASHASYLNHLKFSRRHGGGDAYRIRCPVCDKGFRTKGERRDHLNYRHRGKTIHKCHICDKVISSERLLKRHLKEIHYGQKKEIVRKAYLCQSCGKIFRDTTALREHEAAHAGAAPLACELCGKTYRSGGALYTHRKYAHNVVARRLLLEHTASDAERAVE